jgi:ribosomal protein S18 acetylase RimI-like enzyme
MTPLAALTTHLPTAGRRFASLPGSTEAQALTQEHLQEVLTFLAERPLHTVAMAGMIRDNGVESQLNRGTFYACRNSAGELEGVALIGHATLVETRTDRALEAFAYLAQSYAGAHMLLGEQARMQEFWDYYAEDGQRMRLACRELLFELKHPFAVHESVEGLRPATLDDLDLVAPAQAQMALEESGVNPLEVDPEGFRRRCARRIERGRTWVLTENGRLVFKAEVQSETPQVMYLEGVYVSPEERGKGYALRCLSHLSRLLLQSTGSICLLVNEENTEAHNLYRKAGYKARGYYDTIFLSRDDS